MQTGPVPAQIPLAIAILAGGQSTRMGSDKSFALLRGRPLIEHVMARLEIARHSYPGMPLFIVSNNISAYRYLGVPICGDVLPCRASLSGLYSALWHSPAHYTLCVACDMPELNPALLEYLIQVADGFQAVVPRVGGHLETLHAVYGKSCLPLIRDALDKQQLKINRVIAALNVNYVDQDILRRFDPELYSFCNLNTLDDLVYANGDRGVP